MKPLTIAAASNERKVHTLTVGPKEEKIKPKPSINEPITEIVLISRNQDDENTPKEENEVSREENVTTEAAAVAAAAESSERDLGFKTYIREQSTDPVSEPSNLFHNKEPETSFEQDPIEKRSKERIQKLKDLSMKLRSPQEVDQMEKTPAYIRRQVELHEVNPSSESEVSRFTLGEGTEGTGDLKTNNSFLHDNVD